MASSSFDAVDAALIRVAAYPDSLILPPLPDLTGDDTAALLVWLRQVWPLEGVARAVTVASPDLARTLTHLHDGLPPARPRQVHRAVEALVRYLLRWTTRPTPFGRFAGIAPVDLADHAFVRWGGQHVIAERADATWLADLITRLEARPDILRRTLVQANNLGFRRGAEWIMPCQPAEEGRFADVALTLSPPISRVLAETSTPIRFSRLLARMSAAYPDVPAEAIEDMLTGLVKLGVLVTALRPPMTVTDPHHHVLTRLQDLDAAVPTGPGERPAVDVRLDCSVALPPAVVRVAEQAASLLSRVGPQRPVWQAYRAAFLERYGPGAVVAVREMVDPDRGIGYPADYRGSITPMPQRLSRRDATLARLAQTAALEGCSEVVLDDRLINDLSWSTPGDLAPHTELRFSLSAATPAALDSGDFTLTVASASRHAATTVGRFLYLLEPSDRDRIIKAYRNLPTSVPDAVTVQLSCPPLRARAGNLARTPAVFPLLPLAEHYTPQQAAFRLKDLAVTADAHRLYLLSTTTGQIIEPVMLNAVDLRFGTQPMARLLCEISTGHTMPCRPFLWGQPAEGFPFLPRLRHGRIILSPARWIITADQLPSLTAPNSEWISAFDVQRTLRRVPDRILAGDDDVVLGLDLTEPEHLVILRGQLNRAGTVTLTEADIDAGWIGGRPHEIVLALAKAATAPTAPARPIGRRRTATGPGHLPGASPWLYVQLFVHPGRQNDLLTTHLPTLLSGWTSGPPDDWWYLRYHEPEPHLRVRLRLHHPDQYGNAARALAEWAARLHDHGLLRDLVLATYRPETGRFGHDAALRAAETVFAADSALALAHLQSGSNPQAATAASYLDLATGFLGADAKGWLIDHVSPGGAPALDRTVLTQARHYQGPAVLVERRRNALAAYRFHVLDIDSALADLLHLHHARMIGIDAASERTCMRLARAVAQTLITRGR